MEQVDQHGLTPLHRACLMVGRFAPPNQLNPVLKGTVTATESETRYTALKL